MTTLEELKYLPIWLILFLLLITVGTFFFKQSLLTHVGDEYLRAAANKGKFEASDIEGLLNKLDRYGFDKDHIEVEISPANAFETGISKDSDELISFSIDTNKKALVSVVFNLLDGNDDKFCYRYSRVAKSEEFFEGVTP